MDFQGSLFGALGSETASIEAPTFDHVVRRELTRGAWVDVCPAWLPEADDVFAAMVQDVPWRAERRQMYDREVAVPACCTRTASASRSPIRPWRGLAAHCRRTTVPSSASRS